MEEYPLPRRADWDTLVMMLISLIIGISMCLSIYLSGFLLTKQEINTINACKIYTDNSSHWRHFHKQYANEELDIFQKQSKIFFIIIDALRLDFLTMHANQVNNTHMSQSYNHFTTVHELLLRNSSQCALFGFRADSPTTTSQRLKAITTGGLPTFVDFGANFDSSLVVEDSLLRRWSGDGKKIVMLGDDTWLHLFPADNFAVSNPFDSFNTRDLYTVDNGIFSHIDKYLDRCDFKSTNSNGSSTSSDESCPCEWDILIAHFLGVDHVGHTFHAHHPLMAERLQAMNDMIARAVKNLPDDALLVVMGDHGMTDDGEHGGNSQLEVNSGLFVYSKSSLFTMPNPSDPEESSSPSTPMRYSFEDGHMKTVSATTNAVHPRPLEQVDLAPTLAVVLGDAIPYTSLGMVCPELLYLSDELIGTRHRRGFRRQFDDSDQSSCADVTEACKKCQAAYIADPLAFHMHQNAIQVFRYLFDYFDGSSEEELLHRRFNALEIEINDEKVSDCGICTTPNALALPDICPMCADNLILRDSQAESDLRMNQGVGGGGHMGGEEGIWKLHKHLLIAISTHQRYIAAMNQIYSTEQTSVPTGVTLTNATNENSEGDPSMARERQDGQTSRMTDYSTNSNGSSDFRISREDVYANYNFFLRAALEFARLEWNTFDIGKMTIGSLGLTFFVIVAWSYVFLLCTKGIASINHSITASYRHLVASYICNWNKSNGVSVGVAILFVLFNMLSSCSNSFIVEAPAICYFELQTMSLVAALHHVHLIGQRCTSSSTSINKYFQRNLGVVPDIACFILVRCMWDLRGVTSAENINIDRVAKCIPYLLISVLVGTLPCIRHLRSARQREMGQRNEYDRLLMVVLVTCLVAVIDFLPIHSPLDAATTLRGGSLKTRLEKVVLLLSFIGCLWSLITMMGTCPPKNVHAHVDHRASLTKCCSVLLYNTVVIALHLSHIVIVLSKRPDICALLLVMGVVYVMALVQSMRDQCCHYQMTAARSDTSCQISTVGGDISISRNFVVLVGVLRILLLGKLMFFITGHHFEFSTLQLDSGFVGAHSFELSHAGVMVAINTCGFDWLAILSSLCVSLILTNFQLQLPVRDFSGPTTKQLRQIDTDTHVTAVDSASPDGLTIYSGMRLPLAVVVSYHCSIVAGSCVGISFLTRHLMLWAIFAPKVIFDAGFWLVNMLLVVILCVSVLFGR